MKQKILELHKITNCKWLNLFAVKFSNSKGNISEWVFASRKEEPIKDNKTDAVVIIPTIETSSGKKLVVIKEYRVAIGGYEYGFPAGLIEDGLTDVQTVEKELKEETGLTLEKITHKSTKVYSSAGLSDEACIMYFVEASGTLSDKYQESGEDIEVLLMDVTDVKNLLEDPDKKIGAKAWGIFFYYSQIGEIR